VIKINTLRENFLAEYSQQYLREHIMNISADICKISTPSKK